MEKTKKAKVVILCGGEGTRLREETEFKPKPLVEIGGMPIVWHIMKHFSEFGFTDFILCLGYKGRLIKEYFMEYEWDSFDFTVNTKTKEKSYHKDREIENWNITFANTGLKTLTSGRVKAIEKYIPEEDDYFLLTYGDGVSDINIDELIKTHKEMGKTVTITGVHPTSKYGIINLRNGDAQNKNKGLEVLDFAEKPAMKGYINGGFMVVSKSFFKHITEDCMFESRILPKLAKINQVALYPHEGFWHCMDTFKDYKDLNAMWKDNPKWKMWNN